MKMKTNVTEYQIPLEVFADILRVILKNKIAYQIIGAKARTNVILLEIAFKPVDKIYAKAKENIEVILKDYSEWMEGLGDAILYDNQIE